MRAEGQRDIWAPAAAERPRSSKQLVVDLLYADLTRALGVHTLASSVQLMMEAGALDWPMALALCAVATPATLTDPARASLQQLIKSVLAHAVATASESHMKGIFANVQVGMFNLLNFPLTL